MPEEETKPVEPETETPVPEEDNPQDLIGDANHAADRLEEANKKMESLIQRQEALKVEETLGGTASAGTKKELTKDEKITAEAKKYLKGTGFEDVFPDTKV